MYWKLSSIQNLAGVECLHYEYTVLLRKVEWIVDQHAYQVITEHDLSYKHELVKENMNNQLMDFSIEWIGIQSKYILYATIINLS